MTGRSYRSDDSAVSDMVGTVLLIGISVAMFSGLAIVVMDEINRTPPPANAEFRVQTSDERTTLSLVWGESLLLEDTELIFDLDGVRQNLGLGQAPLDSNLVHRAVGSTALWDLGESLRLSCPLGDACAYPGADVEDVSVIQASVRTVLFSTEPGVLPGAVVSPVADLVVDVQSVVDPARPADPTLYTGGTFVVTARVSNGGLLPTPTSTALTVEFFLDGSGSPFHSYQYDPFLAPGASFTTANAPVSLSQGSHSVRVEVDSAPSFLEAGFTNNAATQSIVIAAGTGDPGGPFEDGNDDALYNPYVASDTLLAASAVTDGVHTATAGKGLVIPASVGTITTGSQNIQFVATQKLNIGVWLETTNGKTITLTAGTDLNLTGSVRVRSAHDLTMTGGTGVDISSDTLDTNNRDISITATTGPLRAVGTLFYLTGFGSDPDEILVAGGGLVDLYGAVLVGDNDFTITSGGTLNLKNANLDSGDDIQLNVGTNTIYVQGVTINEDNDCADTTPFPAIVDGVESSGRVERLTSPC